MRNAGAGKGLRCPAAARGGRGGRCVTGVRWTTGLLQVFVLRNVRRHTLVDGSCLFAVTVPRIAQRRGRAVVAACVTTVLGGKRRREGRHLHVCMRMCRLRPRCFMLVARSNLGRTDGGGGKCAVAEGREENRCWPVPGL